MIKKIPFILCQQPWNVLIVQIIIASVTPYAHREQRHPSHPPPPSFPLRLLLIAGAAVEDGDNLQDKTDNDKGLLLGSGGDELGGERGGVEGLSNDWNGHIEKAEERMGRRTVRGGCK